MKLFQQDGTMCCRAMALVDMLEWVLQEHPDFQWKWILSFQHQDIIHADAHVWGFLKTAVLWSRIKKSIVLTHIKDVITEEEKTYIKTPYIYSLHGEPYGTVWKLFYNLSEWKYALKMTFTFSWFCKWYFIE
jgi:hypothetical protein